MGQHALPSQGHRWKLLSAVFFQESLLLPSLLPGAMNAKPWGLASASIPSPSAGAGNLWRAAGMAWLLHGQGDMQEKARDIRERS